MDINIQLLDQLRAALRRADELSALQNSGFDLVKIEAALAEKRTH